jgi:putative hydrolase of the HAD superfamily
MTKYKWLLFDADGTLFDYDLAEGVALQKTFLQIGHQFEAYYLDEYRRINNQIWLAFEEGKITQTRLKTRRFELLFETINLSYNTQDFSSQYLDNLAQCTQLIDGAEDIFKVLGDIYKIAIITNGLGEVQRPRLERSSLCEYIREIIISEEVGAAKPDRKIFEAAFERMNNPAKSEVLMIGDSITSDILGGINYGLDTCWFNPRERGNNYPLTSTYEIRKLSELLGLLGLSER